MSEEAVDFIDGIISKWDEKSAIDDAHLDHESLNTVKLHSEFVRMNAKFKHKFNVLKSEHGELKMKKIKWFRGELSKEELEELGWMTWQYNKVLKGEMSDYLEADPDMRKIKDKMDKYETAIYILDEIIRQINSRNWVIRNAIDFKKYAAGLI